MGLPSCQGGAKDAVDQNEDSDVEDADAGDRSEADFGLEGSEEPGNGEEEERHDMDIETHGDGGCTEDSQCDDLEPCNGRESCDAEGSCISGEWLEDGADCVNQEGESGQCRGGVCIPLGCGNGVVEPGEECDDGNSIPGDGCENDCTFSCRTTGDCDDYSVCTMERCVPGGGGMICEYENTDDTCDDADECTINDACSDGTCTGVSRDCDDDNICTDDSCDPASGCIHGFNTAPCDDGDPCTSPDSDHCDGAGNCIGGLFVCECASTSDCASHENGNLCDGTYFCDGDGFCRIDPSTVIVCDPSLDTDCTKNRCDPATGICLMVEEPDATYCSDGNACTDGDECMDGRCLGGPGTNCDDRNDCTLDSCDPALGCLHELLTATPCDDGDICSEPDLCDLGACISGPLKTCNDMNECTSDVCNPVLECQYSNLTGTACNDADACTDSDTCYDGVCSGNIVSCEDFNGCTSDSCNTITGCQHDPLPGAACDDGLFCTAVDRCDGAGGCAGSGARCDDGVACTTDACDEGADTCASTIRPGFCLIGGVCYAEGMNNPGNDCQWCDTATGQTAWTNKPAAAACAGDGIGCTRDLCNGSGACESTPDDLLCPTGDLCRPACSADPSGCVTPPDFLDLACTSPVTIPNPSTCDIDLDTLPDQSQCLSCTSKIGMILLEYADFGDAGGACESDGWSLVSGNSCTANVNACTPGGGAAACCDVFSTICTRDINGKYVLRSDKQYNCGGFYEQWRLTKTFNTTGITDLTLCFDYADYGADANEGLLVYAADGTHNEQVFCQNGEPQPGVDYILYPYCVSLPAWAENNPNLAITFYAHSDNNRHDIHVNDIRLWGWPSSCSPVIRTVFSETFTGCPNPIPSGWNGWTITGIPPACPGSWNCASGTSAEVATLTTVTLQRQVDTSLLDGNVTLCFSYGDNLVINGNITVDFDAQKGAGWQRVWFQNNDFGPDGTCRPVCFNLSDINPDVNRNPSLLIRLRLVPLRDGTYDLDDISVSGAVYCSAAGEVSLSDIGEIGGGLYRFTATDLLSSRLAADIQCSWDSPPAAINDVEGIDFLAF